MSLVIGRNRNTNNEATLSDAITLNSSTSIKILDSDTKRIYTGISNIGNQDVWLKLQAASVDNEKKGIFIPSRSFYELPPDNVYTGEISAITMVGAGKIFITNF